MQQADAAAGRAGLTEAATGAADPRRWMGVTAAAYAHHWRAARQGDCGAPFRDAAGFLVHCARAGAGGVQMAVEDWDAAACGVLRQVAEENDLYLEGQVRLPRQASELDRFASCIRAGVEAGIRVFRTVALGSRRYETFRDLESYRVWEKESKEAIARAVPVMERTGTVLAVENHKDWRVPQLLSVMQEYESEHLGICVDFGNSLALLEDGMEVIRAYAPYARTTHFKDMAVREVEDGFQLAEVLLGEGLFDLVPMVEILSRANPSLRWNLEMITRDPLPVRCLRDEYWVTLRHLRAPVLGRALQMLAEHGQGPALPSVSGMGVMERLAVEERNVRACLAWARLNF